MKAVFAIALVVAFVQCALATNALPVDNSDHNTTLGCSPISCGQMVDLVKRHFPAQYQNDMICIAHYESSWCPVVYNGICCYGLWQINRNHLGDRGCPSTVDGLYNADANAQCALAVLNSQGLNAWTTWTSGDCRRWSGCHV
eukprot:TRINITY_DN94_c0_g2_i1.p2 TRINITY_DN94_c0_g2~~TRINITY_DN94_c0_g2_i1.p2  ORF type:complete len:142 (-),score=18.07 TRINITY_DN94_c0_g2_i1:49-474(-)